MIQAAEPETYLLKQIDNDYYQLKKPVKIVTLQQDGVVCASIQELEIYTEGNTVNEAISKAFNEMIYLFEVITEAPIYSVLHEEILSYRLFLRTHVYRIQ